MDVMTKDGDSARWALGRLLLGWTNFEARVDRPGVDSNTDADAKIGQLTSTGHIQYSRARSCFSAKWNIDGHGRTIGWIISLYLYGAEPSSSRGCTATSIARGIFSI